MPLLQDCGFAHSELQKAAYMKLYLACVGCPDLPDCRDKTCQHAHTRAEQEGTPGVVPFFRLCVLLTAPAKRLIIAFSLRLLTYTVIPAVALKAYKKTVEEGRRGKPLLKHTEKDEFDY